MLYEAVRMGSQMYHDHPESWDRFYLSYMKDKRQDTWDTGCIDETDSSRLIRFLNQWSSRYQSDPREISTELNGVLPFLNRLRGMTFCTLALVNPFLARATPSRT